MSPLRQLCVVACVAAACLPAARAANSVSGVVFLPTYAIAGGGPGQTTLDLFGTDSGGLFETAYNTGGSLKASLLSGTIQFNAFGTNAAAGVDLQLRADFQLEGPPTGAATVPVTFGFKVHATGSLPQLGVGSSLTYLTSTLRSQQRLSLSVPQESSYVYQWSIDGAGVGAFEQWIHQPSGTVTIESESRGGFDIVLTTTENLRVQSNGRSAFVDVSARLLGGAGGAMGGGGALNGLHTGQLAVTLPAGYRIASGIDFLSLPPEVSPVPEPGTAGFAAVGCVAVALAAARRRQRTEG